MQVEQALATLGSPVEQIKRELHAARRSGPDFFQHPVPVPIETDD